MNRNIIYKAFSNEQRLKLLQCLSKPKNVNEMLKYCSFTQSALSQHLKILRDANVVKTYKQGRSVMYNVVDKKVTEITKLLLNYK